MGRLDDIVSAIVDALQAPTDVFDAAVDFVLDPDALGSFLGEALADVTPADEVAGVLSDTAEEFVLAEAQEAGQLTPENVEETLDEVEGGALALGIGLITSGEIAEATTGFQMEINEEVLAQAAGIFGFGSLLGREIDARLQEGIDPALKQLVHKDHRSKQADFIDFVEGNLALRSSDQDILPREGIDPGELPDYFNPKDLGWMPDPDTYGTIPDQTGLYELAALQTSEPEELIEEPVQYGIPVPKLAIEQVTELRGIPEDAANIYEEVIEQLPKTENLIRDYVRLTEFNFRLREKIEAGAIDSETAVKIIEPELRDIIENALPEDRYRDEDRTADEVVDILIEELRRNFQLLESLPPDPPTQGDIESFFRRGVIDSKEYQQLYNQFAGQEQFFGLYLSEQAIRQGAEDIQQQHVLGRLSSSEASLRLGLIGWSDSDIERILGGADPDDIIDDKFADQEERAAADLGLIQEVGDVRAQRLRQFGFETVQAVANGSVEEIAEAAGVGDSTAQTIIASAQALAEAGE